MLFSTVPFVIIFVACAMLVVCRLFYALWIFLFTGKLYDSSSSMLGASDDINPYKLIFTGTLFDGALLCVMFMLCYLAFAGIFAILSILYVFMYPYSLILLITVAVFAVLLSISYYIRKFLSKRRNFVKKLQNQEPEQLFKIVSEGE